MQFWSVVTLSYASFFQPKTILIGMTNIASYTLTKMWVIWCCRDCWPLSCTPTCGSWRKPPPCPSPESGSSTLSTNISLVKQIQLDDTTVHFHFTVDTDPVPYRAPDLDPIFYFEVSSPDSDPILSAKFRVGKCLRTKTKLILTNWSSGQAFLRKYSLCTHQMDHYKV